MLKVQINVILYFQLSLLYVHQIDWSTYIFRICIYRISLKLLSIKVKVCESYPVQRILYRKISISDPLYQRCLYCEINGFFGEVTTFTFSFCQPLHYNLVSWIFYSERGRYKVYATVFFKQFRWLNAPFLKK